MEKLDLLHWLLAFAGALIHILLKVQVLRRQKDYKFGFYIKENWPSLLATILMIPVSLLILSENFDDILPINHVTATLVGYQTNSLFRTLMGMAGKKYIPNDEKPIQTNETNTSQE